MTNNPGESARISRIQTSWSLVAAAHDPSNPAVELARQALFDQYCEAARRYLLVIAPTQQVAEELLQEFAVKFLGGNFRGASEERGSFRKYLKTSLLNLVRSYLRTSRRAPTSPLDHDVVDRGAPDSFERLWREDLLSKAWQELQDFETSTKRPYFSVLKFRVDNPQASTRELAEYLRNLLRVEHFSEAAGRKLLQRAREYFGKALCRSVRDTLSNPSAIELESELRVLGLFDYCAPLSQA